MHRTYQVARSFAEHAPDVVRDLAANDDGRPASLRFLFVSSEHLDQLDELLAELSDALDVSRLLGCSGVAIVSNGEEIEDRPCVTLWSAYWETGAAELAHVTYERTPDGHFFEQMPRPTSTDTGMLLLAEPYSFPADLFLAQLAEESPHFPVAGGMASGGLGPGMSKLILRDQVIDSGAVAGLIRGVPMRLFVSQGCRPIGDPFVITKAERNVIYELGGEAAVTRLMRIHDSLPNRDQAMLQRGIQLGRVLNEYQDAFQYGDFLIRNVLGMDEEDGSLQVNDYFRTGQTVQFHLRDAQTASADLLELLAEFSSPQDAAALVFTCNGRGLRLFDEPHHDAALISRGSLPTAGCFCQGEIGPVGGSNFVHGFSASVALFGEVAEKADDPGAP